MELWEYIEIVRYHKKGWFSPNDNIEERLNALVKIAELGHASTIDFLIPILKDNNPTIQQTTCSVIVHLFHKYNTKKSYYNALRHCDISKDDIDIYEKNFPGEQLVILLAIASLNSNGYVREKAVKKLAETNNEKAIPFIIYRLADWVMPVMQSALQAIEHFKKPEFINALVDNLTMFEWLQKIERINLSYIYLNIMDFVAIENKQYVVSNFSFFTNKTRLLISKHLSHLKMIEHDDLKLLLKDGHFIIRAYALNHFEKLTVIEIDRLLKDPSPIVRIKTLYKLRNRPDFPGIAYSFLADNSASIRELARFSLKKEITDFAAIYNDNLYNQRNIIGSLRGLAETKGTLFIENIEQFLDNKIVKIKKAAFLALVKLDPEKALGVAIQNLDSEYIGIRNTVIEFLHNQAPPEALQKAREVYNNGSDELKKSMLSFFNKVGSWGTITDLMIGTLDANKDIRDVSVDYVQQWRKKITSYYFIPPKQSELERANQVWRFSYEMHEEKKYYNQNPLAEIDFYLR